MANRIALVDDDQNILTSVALTLESEGFDVDCYNDGETALQGITRRPPDLGVFDIKMPRMDGIELLQKIRTSSQVPVIFLTSKDDELDEALETRIRQELRSQASPRHVPSLIVRAPAVPRTRSGKMTELAVADIVAARAERDTSSLSNPESLEWFRHVLCVTSKKFKMLNPFL